MASRAQLEKHSGAFLSARAFFRSAAFCRCRTSCSICRYPGSDPDWGPACPLVARCTFAKNAIHDPREREPCWGGSTCGFAPPCSFCNLDFKHTAQRCLRAIDAHLSSLNRMFSMEISSLFGPRHQLMLALGFCQKAIAAFPPAPRDHTN